MRKNFKVFDKMKPKNKDYFLTIGYFNSQVGQRKHEEDMVRATQNENSKHILHRAERGTVNVVVAKPGI